MYKLCKTEQSARRQRQLEEGLLKAMEQHQYDEISISDLCQQMDVPRKSFYRYFSSKDGALHALIDHTLMEYEGFDKVFVSSRKRTLQLDLERFFRFWKHHRSLICALEKSGISGVLIQRAINYALTEVAFPGRFLPGESRQVQNHVVMFSVCGLMSMMLHWHLEGYRESEEHMASVAVRLLTQPLFSEAVKLI